jgi:sugar O-acyltransferase (sialic acid O-acetyltransferase NeuD family)
MAKYFILAENYNASDSSYKIILHYEDGSQVRPGDLICDIETSKSTFEIYSENSGFIYFNPAIRSNNLANVGETIAIIDDSENVIDSNFLFNNLKTKLADEKPNNFTKKAYDYCKTNKIEIAEFKDYELVTIEIVKSTINKSKSNFSIPKNDNRIIIIGAGGQGLELLDIIIQNRTFDFAGFVDPKFRLKSEYCGYKIIGDDDDLDSIRSQGIRYAAIAAGWLNISLTKKLINKVLEAGFILPNLVHPTAYIYPTAILRGGVQIYSNAVVGANADIGFGTVIQNLALVSHDSLIGTAVFIAPGAKIAGNVEIGDYAIIGMNATVYLRVKIEKERIIKNNESIF